MLAVNCWRMFQSTQIEGLDGWIDVEIPGYGAGRRRQKANRAKPAVAKKRTSRLARLSSIYASRSAISLL
jgi:hypothetical protein